MSVGPLYFYLKQSYNFKMVSGISKLVFLVIKYYSLFRFGCSRVHAQSLCFTFVSTQTVVAQSIRELFIGNDATSATLAAPPGVTRAHRMVGDVVVLPVPRASLVEAGVLQEGDLEGQTDEVVVKRAAGLLGGTAATAVVAVMEDSDVWEVSLAVCLVHRE